MTLDEAVDLTRTGDIWIFRGRSPADRAIQSLTNSPVNHVGMAVALDDLPPLMWHAELGRSLPDLWTGKHQRGVQLHDLRAAVTVWSGRYGQRAWLRQLAPPTTAAMDDAVLRTVARLDGTPFPSSARLLWRWLRGRVPGRLPARLPTWLAGTGLMPRLAGAMRSTVVTGFVTSVSLLSLSTLVRASRALTFSKRMLTFFNAMPPMRGSMM